MQLFGSSETSEEAVVKKMLSKWWQEGQKAHSARREKWRKLYKWYKNQMLPSGRPAYKTDTRANYCFMVVETKVPVLTQNRPTGTFVAHRKDPEAEKRAEKLSLLIGNALWHKLKISREYHGVCWNASVYDDGFWKVGWDPDDGKYGEIFAKSIEPFKLMFDPAANEIQSGRFVCHMEPYPVEVLKNAYPKKRITTDRAISEVLFEDRRFSGDRPTAVLTEDTQFTVERALKKEWWIKPFALGPDPEITNGKTNLRKKYPNGMLVVQVGDEVCDIKEWPHDNPRYPFVISPMNYMAGELYDMGDIEQIAPLQDGLNHILQQIGDITNKVSSPIWLIDPAVGLSNVNKIRQALDKPGNAVVAKPEHIVDRMPQGVPPHLIRQAEDYIRRIFDISGVSEIIQGSGRVTHRTARGIERLYEAATTRIGQSGRNHEDALREVFTLMADLARQFYKEDRVYAVIGGNGIQQDVLEVTRDMFAEDEYSVSIDSATALPQDRISRADLVFNLLKNGVFEMATSPDEAARRVAKLALDAVEFPGREEILAFGAERERTAGQEQAPAGPEGQPGGPPPEIQAIVEQLAGQAGASPEQFMAALQGQPPA